MLESNTCGARPKATSEALCHYWHPVARSTEVSDKPVKVKLLDQPLALWRSNGTTSLHFTISAFTVGRRSHWVGSTTVSWSALITAGVMERTVPVRAFHRSLRIARFPPKRGQVRSKRRSATD